MVAVSTAGIVRRVRCIIIQPSFVYSEPGVQIISPVFFFFFFIRFRGGVEEDEEGKKKTT